MSSTDTITRDRITGAYLGLAQETGRSYVKIRALRERLAGQVENLDEILVGMYRKQEINLVSQSNQRALTPEDRAAAVLCGGEGKHLMYWRER